MTVAFEAPPVGVGLGDAADAGADHVDPDLVVDIEAGQRLAQGLHRTLHVALTTGLSVCCAPPSPICAMMSSMRLPADATRRSSRRLAWRRAAGHVLGQALVGDDHEIVARFRHAGQAEHLHRDRRAGGADLRSGFVEHRAHAAVLHAADQVVAL